MRIIVLDFKYFERKQEVHEYLSKKLGFPEYYGRNLDALYDMLSVWSEEVRFYLFRDGKDFEEGFLQVISDVSEENPRISLYSVKLPEG